MPDAAQYSYTACVVGEIVRCLDGLRYHDHCKNVFQIERPTEFELHNILNIIKSTKSFSISRNSEVFDLGDNFV